MKPKSYEEWLLLAGETEELGQKIALTHKLLRDENRRTLERLFTICRNAFISTLFEKGRHPVSITFVSEDDPAERLREVTSILDTYQGASLADFAGVVYKQTSDFYKEIIAWEHKTLWQYLKWWGTRTLRRV